MTADRKPLCCSFCGKDQNHVLSLIAGPACFICDECVELAWEIVMEKKKENNELMVGHAYVWIVGDDSLHLYHN